MNREEAERWMDSHGESLDLGSGDEDTVLENLEGEDQRPMYKYWLATSVYRNLKGTEALIINKFTTANRADRWQLLPTLTLLGISRLPKGEMPVVGKDFNLIYSGIPLTDREALDKLKRV